MDSARRSPQNYRGLMQRGYSAEDCRKILGGNLLRVFREVEQVSKQLQAENRPRITDSSPSTSLRRNRSIRGRIPVPNRDASVTSNLGFD